MKKIVCSLVFGFFLSGVLLAQSNYQNQDLLSAYGDYAKLPREIAYLHLNKSTYIKGEDIGFTAYVLDRENNRPSLETTNLYCTVSDDNGNVLKSKLILVQNGISENNFAIDSLFTSGEYTFKAYTNWMKNFKEQNYFVQKIKVIDPEVTSQPSISTTDSFIDAQFLPEGGHLLSGTRNTIGVITKDAKGFGIPYVEGKVFDSNGNKITTFKVNKLGIGKFPLTPKRSETYHVSMSFNGKETVFPIAHIELKGISMTLHDLRNTVALEFNTNALTLPMIQGEKFKLGIHNGKELKITDVVFKDAFQVLKAIPYKDLFPGINIFTLFDEKNNPVLERQFFNYEGISTLSSEKPISKIASDSITITLPYKSIDPNVFNTISISVLPTGTKSYGHHHNLLSYTLLQPYVKGTVENGRYYFSDISPKKKYALDNLLLTQGWSSYDWGTIFNHPPKYIYDFEKGIHVTINTNGPNSGQLLLYPNTLTSSEFIDVKDGKNSFKKRNLFPLKDEKIRIGEINGKNEVKKTKAYLQFQPISIPELSWSTSKSIGFKGNHILNTTEDIRFDTSQWKRVKKVEKLDEVVLVKNIEKTRIERLKNRSFGRVDVFNEKSRRQFQYLANYLSQRGFAVSENPNGVVLIVNRSPNTPNNRVPTIFLDGARLISFDVLYRYRLDLVDYIDVNRSGTGSGLRGGGGIIKIFTDPLIPLKNAVYDDNFSEFDFPLTFSESKKFYVPKYNSYTSDFFLEYGIMDWRPRMNVDINGNIHLKVANTGVASLDLFIEGIANNGSLISETKRIPLPVN